MLLKREGVYYVLNTPKPENEAAEWEKADEKAHSTISLLIDDDQIHHIRNSNSALEAWTALSDFHNCDSPGTKVRILREIMRQRASEDTDLKMHVSSMNELLQKFLDLGENLTTDFFMSATLLGSLPRSYDGLITALEARSSDELTPSFVRAKVIEEFKQRKDHDNSNSALKITNSESQKSKEVTCFFCKKTGHMKTECRKYAKWKSKRDGKKSHEKSAANIIEQNKSDEFLFLISTRKQGWILDSGATCHITYNRERFVDLDLSYKENVSMANGHKVKASGKGNISIKFLNKKGDVTEMKIKNVLFVPEIGGNIISVKK